MDGMLLQTVEALGDSSEVEPGGEMWELLQAEKEAISQEILAEGPLRRDSIPVNETEPSEDFAQSFEWLHRAKLEERLRALNDAQDRLIDGGYGICLECGQRIGNKRLIADPAVSLCVTCQSIVEGELFERIH